MRNMCFQLWFIDSLNNTERMNKPTLIKQIKWDDDNQIAVLTIPVGPDRSTSPPGSQRPLFFQPVYITKPLRHPNHLGLMYVQAMTAFTKCSFDDNHQAAIVWWIWLQQLCHRDWVLNHCSKRELASCTHAGGKQKWKTVYSKALQPEYCNGIRLIWKIFKMSMSAVTIFTKMENLEWLDWKETSSANDVKGWSQTLEGYTS